MGRVLLRITNVANRAATISQLLPFAVAENQECLLRSPLAENATLNDHLVWLWGTLDLNRRKLKSLQADGACLIFKARGFRGDLEIDPNGAMPLHLLNASLRIIAH